jgi:hypothetical protein
MVDWVEGLYDVDSNVPNKEKDKKNPVTITGLDVLLT